MKFTVAFENLASTSPEQIYKDMFYDVKKYSKSVYGGPKSCEIEVTGGSRYSRHELTKTLGKGIVVYHTPTSKKQWWGMVNDIEIVDGNIGITLSIDSMANKIAVASSYLGDRITTDWSQDDKSVSHYGTYEMMISVNDMSLDAAENRRDTELELRKYPVPKIKVYQTPQTPKVKLKCIGWLDTFKRRYWTQDEGYEGYTDLGTNINFGNNDWEMLTQSFVLSSSTGWDLKKVDLRIRTEESPTDGLAVELRVGADPGTATLVATTATVDYTDITDSLEWVTFTFATAQTLSTGTTYWIRLRREPNVQDATDFYVTSANEDVGYGNGVLRVYENSSWTTFDPDKDLCFRLYGEKETTEQLSDILTDKIEFAASSDFVVIRDSSSVYTNQFRDGDLFAYDEIIDLLDLGSNSNNRMFINVDPDRYVTVFESTNPPDYILNMEGELFQDEKTFERANPVDCVYGIWIQTTNIFPDTLDTHVLSDIPKVFVDEAEYSNGVWRPIKTRGLNDVFDALGGNLLG